MNFEHLKNRSQSLWTQPAVRLGALAVVLLVGGGYAWFASNSVAPLAPMPQPIVHGQQLRDKVGRTNSGMAQKGHLGLPP